MHESSEVHGLHGSQGGKAHASPAWSLLEIVWQRLQFAHLHVIEEHGCA